MFLLFQYDAIFGLKSFKSIRQKVASCNYKVRCIMYVYHTELILVASFTDLLRRSYFVLAKVILLLFSHLILFAWTKPI